MPHMIDYEEKGLRKYPYELARVIQSLEDLFNETMGPNLQNLLEEVSQGLTFCIPRFYSAVQAYVKFFANCVQDKDKSLFYFKKIIDFIIRLFRQRNLRNQAYPIQITSKKDTIDHALDNLPHLVKHISSFLPEVLEETQRLTIAFEGFKIPKSSLHGYLILTKGLICEKQGRPEVAMNEYKKAYRFTKKMLLSRSECVLRSEDKSFYSFKHYKASMSSPNFQIPEFNDFCDVNRTIYKGLMTRQKFEEAIGFIKDKYLSVIEEVVAKHLKACKLFGNNPMLPFQEDFIALGNCYFKIGKYHAALDILLDLIKKVANSVKDQLETLKGVNTMILPNRVTDCIFEILDTILECCANLNYNTICQPHPFTTEVQELITNRKSFNKLGFSNEEHLVNTAMLFWIDYFGISISSVACNALYFHKIESHFSDHMKKFNIFTMYKWDDILWRESQIAYIVKIIERLKVQPDDHSHLYSIFSFLGQHYEFLGYYEEALDTWMEALDYHTGPDYDWELKMAELSIKNGHFWEALQYLPSFRGLSTPKYHHVCRNLAVICFNLGLASTELAVSFREQAVTFMKKDCILDDTLTTYAMYFGCADEEMKECFGYRQHLPLACFVKIHLDFQRRKKLFRSLKRTLSYNSNEPSKFLKAIWETVFCQGVRLLELEKEVLQVIKENPKVAGVTKNESEEFANSCQIIKHFRRKGLSPRLKFWLS